MLGLRTPVNRRLSDLSRESMEDISAKTHMAAHRDNETFNLLILRLLLCLSNRRKFLSKESSYLSTLPRAGYHDACALSIAILISLSAFVTGRQSYTMQTSPKMALQSTTLATVSHLQQAQHCRMRHGALLRARRDCGKKA